ncbi:glutathione transferase Ure2p class [Trametes coccinea BRFM310]|uniref:Glutathione transferase Ure2p class n=1 Tax=Trametes coccinea (strain BRFM310) TaxID=1353009 RepID=A0A1Y2IVJ9_TRAC3|nr:glutathione transferase Ure2p class [Trametes coccinea BRFM310]
MSSSKQFTLFTTDGAPPNGWKVMIVLEELGLSYEHNPEYTKFNPNGRIPALIDHHANDFAIWESDAILSYLVEKYDTERKISFDRFEVKIIQLQWLFFQASGQGGTIRVFGVLEDVLSKRTWLVGDKCSVADMSFTTYGFNFEAEFPAVAKWHASMTSRESVKKVFSIRKATTA